MSIKSNGITAKLNREVEPSEDGMVPIASTESIPAIPRDLEAERREALAASFAPPPGPVFPKDGTCFSLSQDELKHMDKQVKERIQISQMCRLILFNDGTAALWSGADRVGLSAYEATRLGYALVNGALPVERQEGKVR